MIKSCYIHIPFCTTICSYCDFCKMLYQKEWIQKYLDTLEEEIEEVYQKEELETIYIGGGTPSSLSEEELERLFKILDKLNKKEELEYTIEGNFETTTKEKLEIYKKHGVNRLSFGIESQKKENLEFLERTLEKERVKKVLQEARELGFQNINVDLIYALPNETIKDLKEDLDYIFSLKVEHISTYSLIIEENTKLYKKKVKNISEDLDYEMYELICKEMNKRNYNHYEISNFSKEKYHSKHNGCYWNNEEYYGFGLGASSYIKSRRIQNTKSINQYLKKQFRKEIELLEEKDKIEYEIMLNLRKKEGINLRMFQEKFQKELKDLYDYEKLLKNNFLCLKENHLFIPEDKWYISNEIIVKILEGKYMEF